MSYFSDREIGERPRDRDEINEGVWGGIRAIIRTRIDDGCSALRILTCVLTGVALSAPTKIHSGR
jgi:hypothetical protein